MSLSRADVGMLQAIRADIEKAFEPIAKAHGLKSLTLGCMRLNPDTGEWTAKVSGLADGGTTREEAAYDSLRAFAYPTLLNRGATIVAGRAGTCLVVGATERRPVKIIIQDGSGNRYKMALQNFLIAHCPKGSRATEEQQA